jgi:DNA (cytosine-5)-methyltransferase 1
MATITGASDNKLNERDASRFSVVDLFSGAGGMSCGFHRHKSFKIIAAADAEIGKPSMGDGALQCNATYKKNIGISPVRTDLGLLSPSCLRNTLKISNEKIDVLCVCPPCTGFSRANPLNHMRDDSRNSLVKKAAEFAVSLDADIVVMENARELIRGNFSVHFDLFHNLLKKNGYAVSAKCYLLSDFGLPQIRERAIVLAIKRPLPMLRLEDMWHGWQLTPEAVTVRRAFDSLNNAPFASGRNDYPSISDNVVMERLRAIPHNGGSWIDLLNMHDSDRLMTNSMKRILKSGKIGSHPDVYGRMAWDRPAPTIKRECAHIGNGRYAHPVEDRLCSIREMATLQGFPFDYHFDGVSLSNSYRHIGDAVPPLISYQLANLCSWILSGNKPDIVDLLLDKTHLTADSVRPKSQLELLRAE